MKSVMFGLALGLAALVAVASAQQAPSSGGSSGAGTSSGVVAGGMTLDCPPSGTSSSTTSPSASSGSAGSTSAMAGKRVEGPIKNLSGNSFEVNSVKLELGPSASILVDCKHASVSDLKEGSKVKAAYEIRDGRNMVTIIEAEK